MTKYRIYGIMFSVMLFFTFIYLLGGVVRQQTTTYTLSDQLWNIRFFDTLLQAFVLLVTVMGVIYLEEEWPWI